MSRPATKTKALLDRGPGWTAFGLTADHKDEAGIAFNGHIPKVPPACPHESRRWVMRRITCQGTFVLT